MTELRLDAATTGWQAPRAPAAARSDAVLGLPRAMPLVLDLDGTLIRGDLLYLSFFSILRRNPLTALASVAALAHGRAALKRQLALRNRIEWDRIVLHDDVVALAEGAKAAGRRVVLATAADAVLANQLASRLPWIDQVFASDGRHNLKGANKAELLRRSFPQGFIYAGDSASDLAVWAQSAGVITVNAKESVKEAVCNAAQPLGKPIQHLPGRPRI